MSSIETRIRPFRASDGNIFYKCLACGGVYPDMQQASKRQNPGSTTGHRCRSRPKPGSEFWRRLLVPLPRQPENGEGNDADGKA